MNFSQIESVKNTQKKLNEPQSQSYSIQMFFIQINKLTKSFSEVPFQHRTVYLDSRVGKNKYSIFLYFCMLLRSIPRISVTE